MSNEKNAKIKTIRTRIKIYGGKSNFIVKIERRKEFEVVSAFRVNLAGSSDESPNEHPQHLHTCLPESAVEQGQTLHS